MLFELPELESAEELEQLSSILAAEEETGERKERAIDDRIAQIILRREGEDRVSYGKRVDRFISYIQFLKNTSFITSEISRLQGLKKSRENLAKRLTAMVLYRLEVSKIDKVETAKYTIKVVGKGGKQPIEIDYDEVHDLDLFPPEFIKEKVVRSVDKDAIATHLKTDNELSWARLIERGNRLSIK